ncbi:MAG: V-type ATP synthase subunit E [Ruminococcus sp.]|nr:V-type ATP synthase subunit E [Ruminococcus sp.]
MPKDKTDNFLKAIKRYAKEQKDAMHGEVRQLKSERLKEAEEEAKRESQRRIKENLRESRSRKTAQFAKLVREGRSKLFLERTAMVDEIFEEAKQRLIAYSASDEYQEKLKEGAKAIAQLFEDSDCVIMLAEKDLGAAEQIKSFFGGAVQVQADPSILIGGVRGRCGSKRIIADETLDTKLEAQREWFVENSALQVM